MAQNRSKDTAPERQIRSALFKAGLRYRVCDKRYPGSPDIVFPRYYAVVFINGCFWHAHENCARYRLPRTNQQFWKKKFARNRERDQQTVAAYRDMSWRVCVIWECAIRGRNAKGKIRNVTEEVCLWLEEGSESLLEIRG